MPLTNIKGVHVAKYRSFRSLLGHNHAALNSIAVMEQMYHSGRPFGLGTVRTAYEELLEAVFGVIYSLEAISGRKYPALIQAAGEIDEAVSEEIQPGFECMSRDIVVPFEEITPDLKKMVGAKAGNLAVIKNVLGFPVPDGFAITAHAFKKTIEENQLAKPIEKELSEISPDDLADTESICRRIQAMIMNAPIPHDVEEGIIAAYEMLEEKTGRDIRIAMRSSAIGEDTEATFAGQYTSVLNVGKGDIIDAYKTVIASKYSAKAVSYRLRYGLSDSDTPMCVAGVVMIDPLASGVVYTRNSPADGNDTLRITALPGLGEQLVDGSASSDMFTVDRISRTVVRRDISRKEYRLVASDGGNTRLEAIPESEKELPSLDDASIEKLCGYGVMLEEFFGRPQDIEWSQDKRGTLFILQARPLGLPDIPPKGEDMLKIPDGHPVLISDGKTASPGIAAGRVFILKQMEDMDSIGDDSILVAKTASPEYAKIIGRVKGVITDIGSVASHFASVAREFGVPAIVDARDATKLLTHGEVVTMSADTIKVYRGLVDVLAKDIRHARQPIFESPVHRTIRRILDRISPLTLTDPKDILFSPEGCKTLHDIIRFTHEMGMKAMFGITDEAEEVRSIELTAHIPLTLRLIDLGGGLRRGLTTCNTVTPEYIESVPMKAIWKGFTHPGISWTGSVAVDVKKLMTLFAVSAASNAGETLGGISYAILSMEYMNLSARFGYHFATVDTLCSEDSNQNYIAIQFSGGAANYYGKTLRVVFLGNVLSHLGFQVSIKGDLLDAFVSGYDKPSVEDTLDQLGRLFAASRLLDVALSGQNEVEILTKSFFNGDYDFLSVKRDDDLKEFYTHGGRWKRTVEDGHVYCVQDSSKDYPIASGTAGIAGKFIGRKVQDLLDNIEAYYYFPLAVVKNTEISDGTVSVRVKAIKGHIDRAGGIAFGLRNSSYYYVMRINALEDNIILFEYVNGKRYQRAAVNEEIHSNTWYDLSVEIRGNSIRGFLDGRPAIEYSADKRVKGFIGLWTKADSVTCFDALTIEMNAQRKVISF